MKIWQKLLVGLLVITGLVTLVTFVGLTLSEQVRRLRTVELPMEQNLREVEVSIWEAVHAADAYRLTGDPIYSELYTMQIRDIDEFYPKYLALIDTSSEHEFVKEFDLYWRQAKSSGDKLIELATKEKRTQDQFFTYVDEADDVIDFKIQANISSSEPNVLAKERALREVEVSIWEAIHAGEQYTGLTPNIARAGHAQNTFAELMQKQFADVDEFWTEYKALATSEDEMEAIREFEELWKEAVAAGNNVVRLHDQAMQQNAVLYEQVDKADDVIDFKMQAYIQKRVRDRDESARVAKVTTIVVGILATMGTMVVCLVVARSIGGPIRRLIHATDELGKGNLNHRIGSSRNDEMGLLSRAFDRMGEELQLASDRKQAEEALRKAKDFTDNILRSMTDMLVVVSPDGSIITVNQSACNVLGYPEHDLIGQSAGLLFEEEENTAYPAMSQYALPVKRTVLGRVLKESSVNNVEESLLTKNGDRIPVLLSGAVMRDDEGEILGIVCLALDITERKELELRLAESAESEWKRIGRELHDTTGQELTGLGFMAQSVLEQLAGKSHPAEQTIRKMEEGIQRALTQVRQFAQGLVPVELDAGGLMASLQALAADTTEACNIPCTFRHEQPVSVEENTIATQIYLIAKEAVANAVKHAQAEHIEIELSRDDNRIILLVRDDGVGIGAPSEEDGMGLRIMRHRAALIQARLEIEPVDQGGTLVMCAVTT